MDHATLKRILDYDPDTGIFRWKESRGCRRAGDVAGSYHHDKARLYWSIYINGRLYKAHRLAWLYVHGVWPSQLIDHINRDGLDNRIANLRDVSNAENCDNRGVNKNSSTGVRGVTLNNGRYWARLNVAGKRVSCGLYDTVAEAAAAINQARTS